MSCTRAACRRAIPRPCAPRARHSSPRRVRERRGDPQRSGRGRRCARRRRRDGLETVLWFEHDLHDQLQLIQILARIADQSPRGSVRLISLDRFPGHPRFRGLGELSAEELATLWPRRGPISDETLAAATLAYDTLRAADPARLAELADEPLPGLPFLAAALRRLLEEQPWIGSGPGRSERQILSAVAAGARTPADVFVATQEMEEAPFTGDTWLFRRIDDLGRREPALLANGPNGLSLTAAGQAELRS